MSGVQDNDAKEVNESQAAHFASNYFSAMLQKEEKRMQDFYEFEKSHSNFDGNFYVSFLKFCFRCWLGFNATFFVKIVVQ